MKSILLSSVAFALITFSGCADKDPSTDEQQLAKTEVIQEVPEVKTEVVSKQNSVVRVGETIQDKSENVLEQAESTVDEMKESASMTLDDLAKEYATVYFAFDKFNIVDEMQEKITKAVETSNKFPLDFNIKLEGNCDEWGSDEYNFALGLKRADSVKKSLVAEGIDPKRISMVSYGENNPTCQDKTQECWAQNRRVDFKLLP